MDEVIQHSHGGPSANDICIGCLKQQIKLNEEINQKIQTQNLQFTNQMLELKKEVKSEFMEHATNNEKHFNRIYEGVGRLSDVYTRKECDERYATKNSVKKLEAFVDTADEKFASKDTEKNMNKYIGLVVSAVILALISVVISP